MSWLKVRGLEYYAAVRDSQHVIEGMRENGLLEEDIAYVLSELDRDSLALYDLAHGTNLANIIDAHTASSGRVEVPTAAVQSDSRVTRRAAVLMARVVDNCFLVPALNDEEQLMVADAYVEAQKWVTQTHRHKLLSLPEIARARTWAERNSISMTHPLYARSQELVGRDHRNFLGSGNKQIAVFVHGGELLTIEDAAVEPTRSHEKLSFTPIKELNLQELFERKTLPDGRTLPIYHIDEIDEIEDPLAPLAIVMELNRAARANTGYMSEIAYVRDSVVLARHASRELAEEHYMWMSEHLSGETFPKSEHEFAHAGQQTGGRIITTSRNQVYSLDVIGRNGVHLRYVGFELDEHTGKPKSRERAIRQRGQEMDEAREARERLSRDWYFGRF